MKDGVCSWASYLYDYGRGYQETAIYLVNFIKKNKYSPGQKKFIFRLSTVTSIQKGSSILCNCSLEESGVEQSRRLIKRYEIRVYNIVGWHNM